MTGYWEAAWFDPTNGLWK